MVSGRVAQAATGDTGRKWEEAGSLGKDTVIFLGFRVLV